MIKNKIVVGILPTYYYSDSDPYGDNSHFVRMYENKVRECGAIAIGLLHNNLDIYKDIIDAYIWPGGYQITKDFYVIFDDVLKNKKPLLGVCLGSQAIATYFNILEDKKEYPTLSLLEVYATKKLDDMYLRKLEDDSLNLHKNIVTKDQESINNAKHTINIEKDSFMYDIYKKDSIDVVSLHAYSIARTPSDILVSAKSLDNVIEAVEYHKDNNKILGLQYHPEVNNDFKPFMWLIDNAYSKYYVLINKDNEVKDYDFKYKFHDSKYPNVLKDECMLEEQTYYAFLRLKEEMLRYGFEIDLQSGFRTHKTQEELFNITKEEKGLEHANMYVAKSYHSEHESGLAVDICAFINNKWCIDFEYDELEEMYNKLHEIICDFGFILRYPKGKEDITGYGYEPWHLRYIGNIRLAKYIMDNHLCFEEVVGDKNVL